MFCTFHALAKGDLFDHVLHTLPMYKDCLGIMKEQCKNSRLPHLLMIVVHGETLRSPTPQPMDDDDTMVYEKTKKNKNKNKTKQNKNKQPVVMPHKYVRKLENTKPLPSSVMNKLAVLLKTVKTMYWSPVTAMVASDLIKHEI